MRFLFSSVMVSKLMPMKRFSVMLKVLGSIPLCFLSCILTISSGHADTSREVVMSAAEFGYPPYSIVAESGEADGFSVELLREALAAVGHKVSFETGPWNEVKQMLVDRQVDVLPLVGISPERKHHFDFSFPYLTMHGAIVTRHDDDKVASFADLKGKNVVVMQGDNAEEFMLRNDFGVKLITRPSYDVALQELAAGQHDAVVMQKLLFQDLSRELGLRNLQALGPFDDGFKQQFAFAVAKGDGDLLDLLNEGLALTMKDGTYGRLYRRWITHFESDYWKTRRIVVGGDLEYPPYEYLDENGEPAGYNVELTRALATSLGIDVVIKLGKWNKIREGLSAGDIDIVPGMFYSLERENDFHFSQPHTVIQHVAVFRHGEVEPKTLEDLAGQRVVVMAGDIMHDRVVEQDIKVARLDTVATQELALREVARGNSDYALVAKLPAHYWIKEKNWSELSVGGESFFSPEYCYATGHGNEEILGHFSDALASLNASGTYQKIYKEYLGVYAGQDRYYLKYVPYIILGLIVAVLLEVFWAYRLKRQVSIKTRSLEQEIDEHKLTQEKLFERQEMVSLLLDSTAEGIYGVDLNGRCIFINQSACNMLLYDSDRIVGGTIHDLIAVQDTTDQESHECRVKNVTDTKTPVHVDLEKLKKSDGSFLSVSCSIHPMIKEGIVSGAVVTFVDISETEKLKKQQIHNAQMAAVGRLAANIAHEINNPAQAIISLSEVLQSLPEMPDTASRIAGQILNEGVRIGDLVKTTLHYSRKGSGSAKLFRLEEVVNEVLSLLNVKLKNSSVEVSVENVDELPSVKGFQRDFEQIFINLICNSIDSFNKNKNFQNERRIIIGGEFLKAEENIIISVYDNGCGINAELLERVTESFFTTKDPVEGTGLGLSIVKDLADKNGCSLDIESIENEYTRVNLTLKYLTQENLAAS